jgi:hypothetical protein
MIYRGQDILVVVRFGSLPYPTPHSSVSKFARRHTGRLTKRDNLLTGEGERRWEGSRIIRQQENLALYKSLSTHWVNTL